MKTLNCSLFDFNHSFLHRAIESEINVSIKIPCLQETIEVVRTHLFFWPGWGSGTLMQPKNHYMGVVGLLVRELEPEKDLKAEKG